MNSGRSGGALNPGAWEAELDPKDPKRDWLLTGIYNGFHVIDTELAGVQLTRCISVANYESATVHNRANVEKQLTSEINNGRYVITEEVPVIISALGAIPKTGGGIRLIHDASRPENTALNDFCPKEGVQYQTLQDAVDMCDHNYYMAKIDLSEAYRSVKIHPSNYKYTGLCWQFSGESKKTYMYDARLSFGCRRSPYVFNELTQAVVRMMAKKGFPNVVAFLDDFIVVEPTYARCDAAMRALMLLLRSLGFAINYSKVISPSQRLTFLGIVLDTKAMTLELPSEKLDELKGNLEEMFNRRRVTKKDLQRLAGRLNWATQCIHGGTFYLRRIHDVIARLRAPHHRTHVTRAMRADMGWWLSFLDHFNGTMPMLDARPTTPIYTDACPVAAGAVYEGHFVHMPWEATPEFKDLHINFKETVAVELALTTWAPYLANKKVLVHCDNKCAVALINKGSSKNTQVMDSLRRMFWLSVTYNFKIIAQYYPGVENKYADLASRLHERGAGARCQQLGIDLVFFPPPREQCVQHSDVCGRRTHAEVSATGFAVASVHPTSEHSCA